MIRCSWLVAVIYLRVILEFVARQVLVDYYHLRSGRCGAVGTVRERMMQSIYTSVYRDIFHKGSRIACENERPQGYPMDIQSVKGIHNWAGEGDTMKW